MKIKLYCIWGTLLAWAVKLQHFRNWSGLSRYIFKPCPLKCFAQLPACLLASLSVQNIARGGSCCMGVHLHTECCPGECQQHQQWGRRLGWGWALGTNPCLHCCSGWGSSVFAVDSSVSWGQAGDLLLESIPCSELCVPCLGTLTWPVRWFGEGGCWRRGDECLKKDGGVIRWGDNFSLLKT